MQTFYNYLTNDVYHENVLLSNKKLAPIRI